MAGYRIFFMSDDGHIKHKEEFVAEDDQEALKCARTFLLALSQYPSCELWQEKRKVCGEVRREGTFA